jgi:predicted small secreted protein
MIKHFVLIALAIAIAGCNTLQGMGKDIEKAGEAVQKSTN